MPEGIIAYSNTGGMDLYFGVPDLKYAQVMKIENVEVNRYY